MSKTLTISIMNKEFQVACPEGEEEALQRAARYLSEQMQEIRQSGKGCGNGSHRNYDGAEHVP